MRVRCYQSRGFYIREQECVTGSGGVGRQRQRSCARFCSGSGGEAGEGVLGVGSFKLRGVELQAVEKESGCAPNRGLSDELLAGRWGVGLRAKGLLRP